MTVIVSGNLFAAELEKLVKARIEELTTNMTLGIAIHNIEGYRESVGEIRALNDIFGMMEKAADIVDKTR
jgi:hypothetical protein